MWRSWGWALLALAIFMRLFALYLASDVPHYGDPGNYLTLAQAVLDGRGLALPAADGSGWVRTASFPPLYPLVLAAVGGLVPLTSLTLTVLHTSFDCAAALLLGLFVAQLGRRDLAVPLGLAYLLWPSVALMAPLAFKDGLAIALLLAAMVALLKQARYAGYRWAIVSGIASGALILTQPAIAPFLPLAFLALSPCFESRGRWFRLCLAAAAAATIVLLPWWVRNAMLFGQFIPLTTSSGLALWQGAHPKGGMQYQMPPPEWAMAGELAAAKMARAAAWDVISADPLGYLQRCLAKLPSKYLMSNWAVDQLIYAKGQPLPELADATWLRKGPAMAELFVAMIAYVGLVLVPRSLPARLMWAALAQVFLFGIWFEFGERHRLFMTPFVLLMAASFLFREQAARPALQRP